MSIHKKIGMVGGMGPLASARLFDLLIRKTAATADNEHIRIFIDDNPQIPDRTAAILAGGPSPVPAIAESIGILKKCGADFIIIPCNTSHYFYDEMVRETGADIVNMITETGKILQKRNISKVGILATSGAVKGNVFSNYLAEFGITAVIPSERGQNEVMNLIYNGVKAGRDDFDTEGFMEAVDELRGQGAQELIIGCTEISVAIEKYNLRISAVDTLDVLAEAAIRKAGYSLKEE